MDEYGSHNSLGSGQVVRAAETALDRATSFLGRMWSALVDATANTNDNFYGANGLDGISPPNIGAFADAVIVDLRAALPAILLSNEQKPAQKIPPVVIAAAALFALYVFSQAARAK